MNWLQKIHAGIEDPDYVKPWRDYLSKVEIKGALPMWFDVEFYNGEWQVVIKMNVPDVNNPGKTVGLTRHETLPPFVYSEPLMQSFVQREARFMYIHEMREQFYHNGQRVDVPHEDH